LAVCWKLLTVGKDRSPVSSVETRKALQCLQVRPHVLERLIDAGSTGFAAWLAVLAVCAHALAAARRDGEREGGQAER
jgi:hypothetical protein